MSAKPEILCVDDEADVLDALERVLRRDFEVHRAGSAAEGIDVLRRNPDIAIILSDQRMPGRYGTDFLRDARDVAPEALRAILSGQMDMADMVDAVNQNLIHRFILKPWDNEYLRLQMLEALREHLFIKERNLLERLSNTDAITQLFNRRYFENALKVESDRSERHGRPVSLVMIDLDHFKKFNDSYGHPEGDRLLLNVARRLLEQVRTLDTVSRYGGEEFAIIMPDTGPDEAFIVAERVRTSFERKPFENPAGPSTITMSLGVATIPLHAKKSDMLLRAADDALYQAKRQGRNRTVVAPSVSGKANPA